MQPRIRLTRSFDERSHTYQGYVLRVDGNIGDETREFIIAVGEGALIKQRFRIGDEVSGEGHPVADPRLETAELYKDQQAPKSCRVERVAPTILLPGMACAPSCRPTVSVAIGA